MSHNAERSSAFPLHLIQPAAQLSKKVVYWVGYPLTDNPVTFSKGLLHCERCKLTRYMWEVSNLIATGSGLSRSELWSTAQDVAVRLFQWFASLPPELFYTKDQPAGLYEFHSQYHCVSMTLYDELYALLFTSSDREETNIHSDELPDGSQIQRHLQKQALRLAYAATTILRDWRQMYGLKILPPNLLQTAGFEISVFLRDLAHAQPVSTVRSQVPSAPISDTYSGFEECFRFLLGTGVHIMMTRGIARMVSLSAKNMQLRFPEPIEKTIEAVADLMWRPTDLGYLNSSYPNRTPGMLEDDECNMENLLRQWQEVAIEE